jgi:hypothetical protein
MPRRQGVLDHLPLVGSRTELQHPTS